MPNMELIVKTDLEKDIPQSIDWNYEELKEELAERLKHYQGLVVTEDTIPESKADRAKLNNLKKAIDDRRKSIQRAYEAPVKVFKSQVDDLKALIDKPIAAIDKQLDVFEGTRKEQKKAEIEEIYKKLIDGLADIFPLKKIWNDRWLNKGYGTGDISNDIAGAVEKVKADLLVLDSIDGEYKEVCKLAYLEDLNISAALQKKKDMEAKAAALRQTEETQRRREAEKQTAIVDSDTDMFETKPENTLVSLKPIPQEEQANIKEFIDYKLTERDAQESTKDVKVIFYDTTSAFRADMKALCQKHNIRYGGIK